MIESIKSFLFEKSFNWLTLLVGLVYYIFNRREESLKAEVNRLRKELLNEKLKNAREKYEQDKQTMDSALADYESVKQRYASIIADLNKQ
jgi:hypothetical protein